MGRGRSENCYVSAMDTLGNGMGSKGIPISCLCLSGRSFGSGMDAVGNGRGPAHVSFPLRYV